MNGLDSPAALLHTPYGRLLLVKLVLVGLMLASAALNRLVFAPAALGGNSINVTSLWHSFMTEQLVGALVLASVAVLGTIHPVFDRALF